MKGCIASVLFETGRIIPRDQNKDSTNRLSSEDVLFVYGVYSRVLIVSIPGSTFVDARQRVFPVRGNSRIGKSHVTIPDRGFFGDKHADRSDVTCSHVP